MKNGDKADDAMKSIRKAKFPSILFRDSSLWLLKWQVDFVLPV